MNIERMEPALDWLADHLFVVLVVMFLLSVLLASGCEFHVQIMSTPSAASQPPSGAAPSR